MRGLAKGYPLSCKILSRKASFTTVALQIKVLAFHFNIVMLQQ